MTSILHGDLSKVRDITPEPMIIKPLTVAERRAMAREIMEKVNAAHN